MRPKIPAAWRRLVRARAKGRCEYCLLHEDDAVFPHAVDHIVARKHGGKTQPQNLAWACFVCNSLKGTDLASIDAATGRIEILFNPRRHKWGTHFRLNGAMIVARTTIGRVTERLLRFNLPRLVEMRELLISEGRYPKTMP